MVITWSIRVFPFRFYGLIYNFNVWIQCFWVLVYWRSELWVKQVPPLTYPREWVCQSILHRYMNGQSWNQKSIWVDFLVYNLNSYLKSNSGCSNRNFCYRLKRYVRKKERKKATVIHFKIEGLFLMNVLGFFLYCGALVIGTNWLWCLFHECQQGEPDNKPKAWLLKHFPLVLYNVDVRFAF